MTKNEALANLKFMAEQQAENEAFWFVAETAPEAYLQHALRELHGLIKHCASQQDATDGLSVCDCMYPDFDLSKYCRECGGSSPRR